MQYELVYTRDTHQTEQMIGAELERQFVPKKENENEQEFLERLEKMINRLAREKLKQQAFRKTYC